MTFRGKVLAAAATVALVAGSASAADAQTFGGAAAGNVPDWNGLYVGALAGVLVLPGSGGAPISGGAHFGFDMVRGTLVYGGEVEVAVLSVAPEAAPIVQLSGRVGVLAGARSLIYGELGVGRIFGLGGTLVSAGIGVEFGLSAHVSSSFEFKGLSGLTPGPPAFDAYSIQWSLNWHP